MTINCYLLFVMKLLLSVKPLIDKLSFFSFHFSPIKPNNMKNVWCICSQLRKRSSAKSPCRLWWFGAQMTYFWKDKWLKEVVDLLKIMMFIILKEAVIGFNKMSHNSSIQQYESFLVEGHNNLQPSIMISKPAGKSWFLSRLTLYYVNALNNQFSTFIKRESQVSKINEWLIY